MPNLCTGGGHWLCYPSQKTNMPSCPREILFLCFKTVCHANILEKIIQNESCHSRNRNIMENCLLTVWCCKRASLAPKSCLHTVLFKEGQSSVKRAFLPVTFFPPLLAILVFSGERPGDFILRLLGQNGLTYLLLD